MEFLGIIPPAVSSIAVWMILTGPGASEEADPSKEQIGMNRKPRKMM